MRYGLSILLFSFIFFVNQSNAQFFPIPVTGFNQDVIAESGPSSLATTSAAMDSPGSNKVMYSVAFAGFAGITNGLPNNGTLVQGADTYQLGAYNTNNALFIYQNQSAALNLVTPAFLSKLRVVCLSTEGPSTVNLTVTFTDGSTTTYITGYTLADWFFGASNIIVQGFGRCSRTAAGPWPSDGLPSNPKIYYIEIQLDCLGVSKQVQKITCNNVTASGNAPYPNIVLLGLSAIPYSQNIIDVITPADCNLSNGSISLTVTGSGAPYTFVWNLTPVQNGPVATGLGPGPQTCTITDANGCINTYIGIVPLNNNAIMTATANPNVICSGATAQLNATVLTGGLTSFTWNPGNLSGATVTVNPATTTTYTVAGTSAIGCTANTQVTVTVNPAPLLTTVSSISICSGRTATLIVVFPQPGYTFKWYDAATGGNLVNTGTTFVTPILLGTTTYYVEAVTPQGCINSSRTPGTVTVNPPPAAATANPLNVCSGTNPVLNVINPQTGYTYGWYNAASSGTQLATGASFMINNVTTTTTYYLETASNWGCSALNRTSVTITVLLPFPAPSVSVANVTLSSLTFSWNAIPGATGYEISTNGGASFQTPSSGANGTTHTISGLAGNTTMTLQVRALGTQPCETSVMSVAVSGTTLSTKEIFVPNVFTPNGDGKNDVLFVYGNYIKTMEFRVFNHWGQMIFLSTSISEGWKGTSFGTQQPVGVYAYTLKAVLQDGTLVNKKGSINLIR